MSFLKSSLDGVLDKFILDDTGTVVEKEVMSNELHTDYNYLNNFTFSFGDSNEESKDNETKSPSEESPRIEDKKEKLKENDLYSRSKDRINKYKTADLSNSQSKDSPKDSKDSPDTESPRELGISEEELKRIASFSRSKTIEPKGTSPSLKNQSPSLLKTDNPLPKVSGSPSLGLKSNSPGTNNNNNNNNNTIIISRRKSVISLTEAEKRGSFSIPPKRMSKPVVFGNTEEEEYMRQKLKKLFQEE